MSKAAGTITNGALRILYLEDQHNDVELVRGWLEDEGIHCEITHVQTGPEFRAALEKGSMDLILSDYHLPAFDGLKALALARQKSPDVPFILFSGTIGEEVAVESLKLGASDYVLKQRPKRLISAIHQALKAARERAKHRLAETKLREQAALLDKAQDAIMVRDLQDCLVYWNKSAERVYGWTAAEAIGKNADQLLFKDASAKIVEAKQEVLERGEWSGELHQVNKDGKPIVVESRRTLVRDSAGQPRSILVINTDITEKRRLEAQFLRA